MRTLTTEQANTISQRSCLDFFSLGSVPNDEDATQIPSGSTSDNIIECMAMIDQLRRMYGEEPKGAELFIQENNGHDAGTYYDVGIFYNHRYEEDESVWDEPSKEYAFKIESEFPDEWDEQALQFLRDKGHSKYQPAKVVKMRAA